MSIYRLAFLESLAGVVSAEVVMRLADDYERRLAQHAAGEYLYVKRGKIQVSQDCVDAAHAMLADQSSIRAIAKHFHVSRWTVRRWLEIPPTNLPPP